MGQNFSTQSMITNRHYISQFVRLVIKMISYFFFFFHHKYFVLITHGKESMSVAIGQLLGELQVRKSSFDRMHKSSVSNNGDSLSRYQSEYFFFVSFEISTSKAHSRQKCFVYSEKSVTFFIVTISTALGVEKFIFKILSTVNSFHFILCALLCILSELKNSKKPRSTICVHLTVSTHFFCFVQIHAFLSYVKIAMRFTNKSLQI